jgi:glycerophosphoryl diester phosphodiesterase
LGLHKLYSPKAQVLHVPLHRSGFEIVTKRFVNNAHEIGLRVQPWTINKPSTMRDLIKMNVDGIITDRPDYLANILRESKTSNQ